MRRLIGAVLGVLLTVWASLAHAEIARGVGPSWATCGSGVTTCAVTLNSTTAGRSLVITMQWGDATTTLSSVTITSESNATIMTNSLATNATTPYRIQQACLANITTGGNKTITMTLSNTNSDQISIGAMEYTGGDTTDFCTGAANGANANSGTPSVNLTTSFNNSLVVVSAYSTSAEPTAATGYTQWTGGRPDAGWFEDDWDDVDVGSAGAKTITAGAGGSEWAISATEYKVAGGGSPPPNFFGRRVNP